MHNRDFIKRLGTHLVSAGFLQNGTKLDWYRSVNDVVQVCSVDKDNRHQRFGVVMGIAFCRFLRADQSKPKYYQCHLRFVVDRMLTGSDQLLFSNDLSFDQRPNETKSDQNDLDRIIREMVLSTFDQFDSFSTCQSRINQSTEVPGLQLWCGSEVREALSGR